MLVELGVLLKLERETLSRRLDGGRFEIKAICFAALFYNCINSYLAVE